MRKITGVLLMTILLALAACGGSQAPTTKVYTSANNGQTITIPATVGNLVLLSGQGAAGEPEYDYYVEEYSKTTTTYNQRNDLGGQIITTNGGTTYHSGPTPENYCNPEGYYFVNGVQNTTQTCYTFSDTSYNETSPETTGASASMTGPNGFSRVYPGGTGGPATPLSAENVAVVAGGQYVLSIPDGASITLSYYE